MEDMPHAGPRSLKGLRSVGYEESSGLRGEEKRGDED